MADDVITSPLRSNWLSLFPGVGENVDFFDISRVVVDFGSDYARMTDPLLEERLNLKGQNLTSTHGRKRGSFRLAGLGISRDLTLFVGPGSDEESLVFRTNENILEGVGNALSDKRDYPPNVISNVVVLLTRDHYTFAVLRSNQASAYQGFLDLPGGHPEGGQVPSKLSHGDDQKDLSELVRQELFESATRTLIENLAVGRLTLGKPLLFSVLLDLNDVRKRHMAFLIYTPHSSVEVHDCFWTQNPMPHDVSQIVHFRLGDSEALTGYKTTPILDGILSVLGRLDYARLKYHAKESLH